MEVIVMGEGLGFLEDISEKLLTNVVRDTPGPAEERLVWDSPLARGYASSIRIRQGLEMQVTDIHGNVPWGFDILHHPRGMELGFSRSSTVRVTTSDGTDVGMRDRRFCISQVKETTRFRCESSGDRRDCGVSLRFDPHGLLEALAIDELPDAFARVFDDGRAYSVADYPMTPAMLHVVDDLCHSDLQGPMRRLYFEGKALELMVLAMDATASRTLGCSSLSRSDVERLEHARSLLHQGLAQPPSLRVLARSCGLNERKLKEGFKERFGTTVFSYVRAQRMSRAREMLCSSEHTVTEVAHLVGYANPSKFAAAFRRQFGIAPSAVAPT